MRRFVNDTLLMGCWWYTPSMFIVKGICQLLYPRILQIVVQVFFFLNRVPDNSMKTGNLEYDLKDIKFTLLLRF